MMTLSPSLKSYHGWDSCACSEADAILFGCGSDPTMQKQIKESLVKSFDNKLLLGFTWSRPMPVMQTTVQGCMYIEVRRLASVTGTVLQCWKCELHHLTRRIPA